MEYLQKTIGKRLQTIRKIYNGGFRCSVEQFAAELNETPANIRNYESGKAGVPNRLLFALYQKGINPSFVVTGEGEIFADNQPGKELKKKTEHNGQGNIKIVFRLAESVSEKAKALKVAAGLIDNQSAGEDDKQ